MNEEVQLGNGGALGRLARASVDLMDHPFGAKRRLDFINYGVRCEICKKEDFEGDRFKCTKCPDFNLCSPCFSTRHDKSKHDGNHPFLRISNPLTKQENDKLNKIPSLLEKLNETLRDEQLNQFKCNYCGHSLFGVRIKCDVCEKVNLCSECWEKKEHEKEHKNHPMILYTFGAFENAKDETNEKNMPKVGCFSILHEVYLKPDSNNSNKPKGSVIKRRASNVKNSVMNFFGRKSPNSLQPDTVVDSKKEVVKECIEILEKRGLTEEGLYRISAQVNEVKRTKENITVNPEEARQKLEDNPHLTASVLKSFLRDLDQPLFEVVEPNLIKRLTDENALFDREKILDEIMKQLECDPLIKKVLDHLDNVAGKSDENKMTIDNLSTIFGPILFDIGLANSKSNDLNEVIKQSTKKNKALACILRKHSSTRTDRPKVNSISSRTNANSVSETHSMASDADELEDCFEENK